MSETGSVSREWWTEEKLVDAVRGVVERSRREDEPRLSRIKKDIGLYIGRRLVHLDAHAYGRAQKSVEDIVEGDEDPRIPLAKSVAKTVHAKLVANLPKTSPVTENGTWTMQRQAKLLEGFLEGVKYRNDWRQTFPDCVRMAEIAISAHVKVHSRVERDGKREVGRILLDKVLPWEIRIDPMEATYGKPRSLFHECLMDRRVAAATWPKLAPAILKDAKRAERGDGRTGYHSHADPVCVIEGWHLPSGKEAGDGKHVIIIEGVKEPVLDEEWTRDHFPIATLQWERPLMGYWGHSLLEDIRGLHQSANEVDEAIRKRLSQSMVFATTNNEMFERIASDDLDVAIFKVAPGDEFEVHTPEMNSPEAYNERDRLMSMTYEMSGVSQLSAQSLKPAGLDAAVAMREYQDIESERFADPGKNIETFDLEVSKLIISEARQLAERGVDVEVSARRQRRRRSILEKIRFKEISLDEDAYELQVFPANQLPRTPAGRLAMVEQLIAAGFLDKDDAMRLLDMPDVESVMTQQLAPYYIALDMVELMIEDGRQVSPIPEMDLATTAKVVRLAILQGEIDELPAERLALLRGFAEQVDQLQARAEAAAMQQQAAFMPNAAAMLQPGMAQGALPQGQAAPVDPAVAA